MNHEKLNVPSFDVMEDDAELAELERIFGRLSAMVSDRREALKNRLAGNIAISRLYEESIDYHYSKLPEWARW